MKRKEAVELMRLVMEPMVKKVAGKKKKKRKKKKKESGCFNKQSKSLLARIIY